MYRQVNSAGCTDIQRWFHGWSDRIAPFFTSQYHVEQVYYILSVELASEALLKHKTRNCDSKVQIRYVIMFRLVRMLNF